MLDAIVQLIRNLLSIMKGTKLGKNSLPWLWDPTILPHYYDLPEPYNKTTVLELMQSITQVYVTFSCCPAGWNLVHTNYGKYIRCQRILWDRYGGDSEKNKKKDEDAKKNTEADRLLHASLMKEANAALRSMWVGVLLCCMGASFFMFATNSIHMTETGLNGGMDAVVHALIVTEIALLPLLYYMFRDFVTNLQKSERMDSLAERMKTYSGSISNDSKENNTTAKKPSPQSQPFQITELDLPIFEALTDWVPFWDAGLSIFAMKVPDRAAEEKLVLQELQKVQSFLDELSQNSDSNGSSKTTATPSKKKDGISKNKDATNGTSTANTSVKSIAYWQRKAKELEKESRVSKLEGYRELVFFILNAVAFYGYLMSIIVYYVEDIDPEYDATKSGATNDYWWIRSIVLFGLTNNEADWYGNFSGDFMWVLEPSVAITTTLLFSSMKAEVAKSKLKVD